MAHNRVLFIGNFLSRTRGTLSPTEKIASGLSTSECQIDLVSRKEHAALRFIEVIWKLIAFKGRLVHIDVYSGWSFIMTEVCCLISRLRGDKVIVTLHGGRLPDFTDANSGRVLRVLRNVSKVFTPSLMLKQYFTTKGIEAEHIPNGIDLSVFPFSQRSSLEAKILWVRAFSEIYQPELAVKVLWLVKRLFPDASLTMIGPDNGLLYKVRELIQELKLEDSVYILGPVSNSSLSSFYHSHSVFLNTTMYESFGIAVMEAAASGTPIVSTSVGELPLLWRNDEELLLVEKNAEKLANAVTRVLSDTALARKLKGNARLKAEMYEWNIIRDRWLNSIIRCG